jgi:hypothetical protein
MTNVHHSIPPCKEKQQSGETKLAATPHAIRGHDTMDSDFPKDIKEFIDRNIHSLAP